MLRIEIDVFSGRPNPVWLLTDEAETKPLIGAIAEAKGVLAKPGAGFTGLGLREVRVGFMADDPARPRFLQTVRGVGYVLRLPES